MIYYNHSGTMLGLAGLGFFLFILCEIWIPRSRPARQDDRLVRNVTAQAQRRAEYEMVIANLLGRGTGLSEDEARAMLPMSEWMARRGT